MTDKNNFFLNGLVVITSTVADPEFLNRGAQTCEGEQRLSGG